MALNPADFPNLREGDIIRIKSDGPKSGEEVYFRRWGNYRGEYHAVVSPLNSQYSTWGVDSFEIVEPPSVRHGYDLQHHILPRVWGWKAWDGIKVLGRRDKDADPAVINTVDGVLQVANSLAANPGRLMIHGVDPRPGNYRSWATFWFWTGQSTSYTGEAYVFVYGANNRPTALKVAVCEHEKTEEGHNPNHSRGWHPGHCKKCGMDMSVDSGD